MEEVIIQERNPSIVEADGASAEPGLYDGLRAAGGFLRHAFGKESTESLNSPGACTNVMCVRFWQSIRQAVRKNNVYGWTAKLGLLAIAHEAKEMGVQLKATHHVDAENN